MLPLRNDQVAINDQLLTSLRLAQLLVAPTGFGKTILAIHWIWNLDSRFQLIVWMTPLTALGRQMVERLAPLMADFDVLLGAGPDAAAMPAVESLRRRTIWIGSPERITTLSLDTQQNVAFVFDEAHTLIEWASPFRESMDVVIRDFRKFPHRALFATATPPLELGELLTNAYGADRWETIGQFALPKNLRYQIIHNLPWAERAQRLQKWVEQKQNETLLVFVQNRVTSERLKGYFQEHFRVTSIAYHAGLSAEEKLAYERRIRSEEPLLLFATSAFGLGMDFPHINNVLLWQLPTSPLSFVQMIGRAARNPKRAALATVFTSEQDAYQLRWISQQSPRNQQNIDAMLKIIREPGCQTSALERSFIRSKRTSSCVHCAFCAGGHSIFGNNIGGSEQTKVSGAEVLRAAPF